MSLFESIRLIPSDKCRGDEFSGDQILVVGHSVDTAQEDGNHWCFHLQLPDGERSVRINMGSTELRGAFHHTQGGRLEGVHVNLLSHLQGFSSLPYHRQIAG